jgi:HEAT repeat protein
MAALPESTASALGEAIERLKNPHDNIRLSALGEILGAKAGAHALAQIAGCLNDSSARVRRAAVTVLAETGPEATTALADALSDRQPCTIRMLAASSMARWGSEALRALDPLIACLGADEEELRSVAALALGKIGNGAVPALRKLLSSSNASTRIAAAHALGHAGHSAAAALEDLRPLTKGELPPPLRLACAAAAVKISGDSQEGLSVMLDALQSADEPTKLKALQSLRESGAIAKEATHIVLKCLCDESATIRSSAALTLGRLGERSADVISGLNLLLADSESVVRLHTVVALSALAVKGSRAFTALQQAQADEDSRVATAATAAVGRTDESA